MTDHTQECIPWSGAVDSYGYGRLQLDGKWRLAHRVEYERQVGPIPEGLTIDHLCRNRLCVNVAHLEPVTNRENVLRGEGVTAQNARRTACRRGHPLSGDNLRIRPNGGRECKECSRARWRAYRKRKLEAGTWTKS